MKYKFKSTAQISTGFTVSEEIKLSDERFNLPQIDLKFNNAIENINSRKVLSLLSYNLMLHDLKDEKPFTVLNAKNKKEEAVEMVNKEEMVKLLQRKLLNIEVLSPTVPLERNLIRLLELYSYDIVSIRDNLNVVRAQRTDYINIEYISENPNLSAFSVNTLCSEFRRFYGIDKKERTDLSIVSLDSLLVQKKNILDQKVQEKNQFMSSQGVLDVQMEGSNKLGQVGSFESQLIEEKANQQNLSYQVSQLNTLIERAKAKGASTLTAPDLGGQRNNSEYIQLRKQYNDLNSDLIEKGGNDLEIKKKMDVISQKMQKMNLQDNSLVLSGDGNGAISLDQLIQRKVTLEGQLRATTQKVGAIQAKISQLNGGLSGMASKSANILQLDKEIEMATSEYKEVAERYNLAMNMNESSGGIFAQRLYGEPAIRPEPSKKMLIMALAAISAFIISSLAIIGIEFFDNSFKTPSQFQRLTGLPLLGTINWMKIQNNNILERVTLFQEKEARSNLFRELLRKLRYNLENSHKKIYLFTSTEPNQGKTLLIQSLAYSLSLSKKRVLIIDTNFCNNDLTVATNANPLLEKFSSEREFNFEDLQSYITKTNADGVDIIGCEGGDYTPSEILPKNHLLNYLDKLKGEYDYIFMEGAPLNGYTDTKELIPFADGLIIIFSAESTYSAADEDSLAFLAENKDKFMGAILNKVQVGNLNL